MVRPSRHIYVLTLLAALFPLTACGDEPVTDTTGAGDVVPARQGVDTEGAAEGHLLVPSGRLDIRAGDPVESIPADATTEREAREAPEGGAFLPLTWTFRAGEMEKFARVFGRPLPMEMTLVSGGKSYSLAPPRIERDGEAIDAYYLAVEGSGEDAEIELEYAGVTQTLDLVSGKREAGEAKGLYALNPEKYSEEFKRCSSENWVDEGPLVQSTFTCTRTDAVVSPFIDGEWAPEGSTFVTIGLTSALTSFAVFDISGAGATYNVASSKEKSELKGQRPTRVLEEEELTGAAAGVLVFTVEGKVPDTLTFRRTYSLVRSAIQGKVDAPYTRTVDVSGSLPLS